MIQKEKARRYDKLVSILKIEEKNFSEIINEMLEVIEE